MLTVIESGDRDYDWRSWGGLLAPTKTPGPVLDQLRKVAGDAARSGYVADKLAHWSLLPDGGCGTDVTTVLQKQYDRHTRIVGAAHLKEQK